MGGKPANTIITLTVTTEGLTTDPDNINNHVVFSDNQSDPLENPGHPETYVSTVNKGATCEWQGVAANGRDIINILSVVKKNPDGIDILNTPIPPGIQDPKGGGKKLTATVRGNAINGDEPYTVNFSINDSPIIYPVDPKIRMQEQTS
ncbi:hypothetical protein FJ651_10100 [Paucihalobacter ruber]|uniref:Uncharacterized protein n=1 Tax=Paucihalobacter ruber TaxID=2567861 RepID=A0A506PIJ2_9FLAO|nr:hypothetical protein [Paucihalobacter ruber]TPV33429.1 hypothetical protein FJ651_10100 [Paucihalobacter ruber]